MATEANKRFNKIILKLGFFTNKFKTHSGVFYVIFDEDSNPLSLDALNSRFQQYCVNNGIENTERFVLTANLPVYEVNLG